MTMQQLIPLACLMHLLPIENLLPFQYNSVFLIILLKKRATATSSLPTPDNSFFCSFMKFISSQKITIKTLISVEFTIEVENSSTIADVKAMIRDQKGIAADRQRLYLAGYLLDEERALSD